eukprot:gene2671-12774_t
MASLLLLSSPTSAKIPRVSGVSLLGTAHGKVLPNALGDKLPAVAKAYDMSVAAFVQEASHDEHLTVDTQGNMFHACAGYDNDDEDDTRRHLMEGNHKLEPKRAATHRSLVAEVDYRATTVFKLHSKPGAKKIIFLDFDGHTIPGTSKWARNFNSRSPIICNPYHLISDANGTSTFDQEGLDGMLTIFNIVAEDFSPWAVDVTIEDPGPMASRGIHVT